MLFDFGGDGSNAYFYSVAFYVDCKHELRPVDNGKRLCLLYNLVRGGGGGPTPLLAHRDAMSNRLAQITTRWELDSDAPRKLCLILDHGYTNGVSQSEGSRQGTRGHTATIEGIRSAPGSSRESGTPACNYYGGGHDEEEEEEEDSRRL